MTVQSTPIEQRSINFTPRALWDYVILTASNEMQACVYQSQIAYRQANGMLPKGTHYVVLPDPLDKRVGSGGATLSAIRHVQENTDSLGLCGKRILVIHSGGDSKRVPQYSASGKLFSPVPRLLPNGRRSTLFDELMLSLRTMPCAMSQGLLVCSGDVLLMFDTHQTNLLSCDAAAFSIKADMQTGENHGVHLSDGQGNVVRFLHKKPTQMLIDLGAVDKHGRVDIDTGAIFLSTRLLCDLYQLIDTKSKFDAFVNEQTRLSFYADFLYPMAIESTLSQYFLQEPEGSFTPELNVCRTALWYTLNKYRMKLISLTSSSFIHFGSSKELLNLMTKGVSTYSALGWVQSVNSHCLFKHVCASNSYIGKHVQIGEGCYIENCCVYGKTIIGEGCLLSGVTLNGETVPSGTALHGLKLNNGKHVVRMYGVNDNPKEAMLFMKPIIEPLWTASIYPVCETMAESVHKTLQGIPAESMISLKESFEQADINALLPCTDKYFDGAVADAPIVKDDPDLLTNQNALQLLHDAQHLDESVLDLFSRKIRIFHTLSKMMTSPDDRQIMADQCFGTIRSAVLKVNIQSTLYHPEYRIKKDEASINLPVRVNWGGGWSDTPPYCLEHGGTVLNAAILLNGKKPINASVRRIGGERIIMESADTGIYHEFSDIRELQDCRDPSTPFALHKAALIACGIIPCEGTLTLKDIIKRLGSSLIISTRVTQIPKGSGLGTSSILAGACVMALHDLMGVKLSSIDLYNRVLCVEQLMAAGGGWQDQVGGLTKGIKLIKSRPGLQQQIECIPLHLSTECMKALGERFCLIYTGQTRPARNLLREVMGHYIGGSPSCLSVLHEIQQLALQMCFELESGCIDGFAALLNRHWELSQKLDIGCTNLRIKEIFNAAEPLIDGKMICGAGAGGYLQVILKRGITIEHLNQTLYGTFSDNEIRALSCDFFYT